MKFLILAGCVLLACNGKNQPSVGSTIPLEPPNTVTSSLPDDCHCQDKVPEPAAKTLAAGPKDWPVPAGFWCASFAKSTGKRPLNVCYSSAATCNQMLKDATAVQAIASECRNQTSAYCFLMVQKSNHAVYWRCYGSTEDCTMQQKKWMNDKPQLQFGRCKMQPKALPTFNS